jgi:hypothetical protein
MPVVASRLMDDQKVVKCRVGFPVSLDWLDGACRVRDSNPYSLAATSS